MSENELFDASYTRIFGDGVGLSEAATPFFEAFYGHFLKHPGIRKAFEGTDMSRQVSMLRKSFFNLAAFYVSHEPSAELTRIATIHHRLGIDPSYYDLWLDALIETVREFDPECDQATELAWRLALMPGITYMRLLDRLPGQPETH